MPEPILIAPPSDRPDASQEASKQDSPPGNAVPETEREYDAFPKPVPPHYGSSEPAAETSSGKYPPLFGTQWPQADVGLSPDLFSDQPSGYRTQEPQPRSKALIVAWVASIALLGAVIIAGVVNRGDIMQAWPPSQRAYAVFGLR